MKPLVSALLFAVLAVVGWTLYTTSIDRHNLLIYESFAKPLSDTETLILLQIDNQGQPDRLISVSSPIGSATLYSPVDPSGVPIPFGSASLAQDGAHIRLTTDTPQQDGSLLPLTLTFATAGDVVVKARLSDPAKSGGASDAGLFGLGDICRVEDGEPAPQISIDVVPEGDGWKVTVTAQEFTFSKEHLGLFHIPGTGHGHLYVGGMKLGRMMSPTARIGGLPPGTHEVRVTLNTNDHRAYVVENQPVTAKALIKVDE